MRIVLLGATGFLGHHLLPQLSAAGHESLALTRYRPACRDLAVLPGVRLKQLRQWDATSLEALVADADAVVSMVGILNESGRNGKGFHKVHVELIEKLIEACREKAVRRIVHVSAIGAGEGSSHYLVTKGEAEALLRAAEEIDETIIRPSVIFGRQDDFFNRFAILLKMAPFLPLACPEARMQPVWAGDVSALIGRVLDDPETIGQTLDAVGPRAYSLRELVAFTGATIGLERRILGLPDWVARLQGAVMDFVPGKPFSSDNYRSLQTPNTSDHNDLPRFGISPRSIEGLVPSYLGQGSHQRRLDDCRRWAGR